MRYTLIAGINGVGKSTIYNMLSEAEKLSLGKRINIDELVSSLGDWKEMQTQIKAGRQAIKIIKDCLEKGCDFPIQLLVL